jgi:general stress protein 26
MQKELEAEKALVIEKCSRLIKAIDFGMLTTQAEDGSLHSRPMSANGEVGPNGELWFFTYGQSYKVFEAVEHPQCNVTFSDIKNNSYVSVSGVARLSRDKALMASLWKAPLKAWFPEGLDTQDIALLVVTAERLEYWDGPAKPLAQTIELLGAMTGVKVEMGDNKKVTL